MKDIIQEHIQKSIRAKQDLLVYGQETIERIALLVISVLKEGGKILLCGNGGSASDAQHIAAEFIIRYQSSCNRRALAALSLNADSSVLTAGANDLGYDSVFARQIEALGNENDLLWGFSTSGNSPNMREAFKTAKERRMKSLLFTGRHGGEIVSFYGNSLDIVLKVPADETAAIQEAHITVGHIICKLVEREFVKTES